MVSCWKKKQINVKIHFLAKPCRAEESEFTPTNFEALKTNRCPLWCWALWGHFQASKGAHFASMTTWPKFHHFCTSTTGLQTLTLYPDESLLILEKTDPCWILDYLLSQRMDLAPESIWYRVSSHWWSYGHDWHQRKHVDSFPSRIQFLWSISRTLRCSLDQ